MPRKFFLTLLVAASMVGASRWDDEGQAWWRNVSYLSSDDLQGRAVGTHGFDHAANYVAEQFERVGLKAAGGDGYFQKIRLTELYLNAVGLSLERNGKRSVVPMPSEAHLTFNLYSAPRVEAPVVFAGYGMKVPEAGYDDLEGLPLKGAVVAYLTGSPQDIPGNLRSHYSSTEVRWQAMKAAGAVGMIAIPNPKDMEAPWERESASWGAPRIVLTDPKLDGLKGLYFSATWNPAWADDLLAGSGHQFAEIVIAAEQERPLPHFKIGCRVNARVILAGRPVTSKNVVAVHPGSDPSLKGEYVIISAHLDHLGMENPLQKSGVFHGAMDDASGVSSVIEIAKMLKRVQTKRSIVFLALTGEEKGELGSAYFSRYPSVNGRMVADINMDMFLPLCPLKWLEVQGLDESTLGGDIKAVAEAAGVRVHGDQEPNKNRFTRSDQYSFVKAGVPAVAFKFSYLKGDPEEKLFVDWYAHRYHAIEDDSKQPVDLAAAAHFNDILKSLLLRVADAQEPPRWHEDSFFRRFAATPIL